jgi:hypothetical protein
MRYFLHVGMPQSASTFLQDVLFPACPELKTISSRDPKNRREFYNPICSFEDSFWSEDHASSWLRRTSDPDKLTVISFERFSSTHVLSRQQVAQRLAKLCPGAKCLIIVRNQLDAMQSAYAQRARVPNLYLPSFAEYVEANMRDPKTSEFRRYFYDEFVTIYEKLFGADSVLVLPFELLRSDGPQFVARVCEFAGVSAPPQGIDGFKVNERISGSYLACRRFTQKLVSPETLRRVWLAIPYACRQHVKSLFGKASRLDLSVSPEQQRVIHEAFVTGNERLSKRRGMQVIEWYKYPERQSVHLPDTEPRSIVKGVPG